MVVLGTKKTPQAWSIVHETANHSHRHVKFVKASYQTDSKTSKRDASYVKLIDLSNLVDWHRSCITLDVRSITVPAKEVTMKRNVYLPSIITLALLTGTPQLFATEAQDREGHQRANASQANANRRSDVQNRRRAPRARPRSPYSPRKQLRRLGFQRPYWHGRRHRPIIAPRYFYPRRYRPSIYPHPFTYRFGLGFNRLDHFGYGLRHRHGIHYPSGHYYYDRVHDYSGFLRLKIRPRDAQVYVDNIFVGLVDDFDGPFQRLRLNEGRRVVEIKKPGFEDFQFEIQIIPGEQETIDALMRPASRYR